MEQISDSFDVVEVISEMGSGATALVPLSPDVIQEVTAGDDDPTFATFIIEGGWSKSKRYWPDQVLDKISEQINNASEPVVGYMGHIKPDDDSYTFPDIQLQWLKSKIQPSSQKSRLLVKAYVLPGTKAREYLKRKLVRSISVRGAAELAPIQGGVKVGDFDLESIDLSRPRKAGMQTALVGISSEMEGGKSVKPEEIAALQENELRAHNKALVDKIEAEAKKPLETKVSEMEEASKDAEADKDLISKLREALGIDENADILEIVGTTMTKLKDSAKSAKGKLLDEVLTKKFKDEHTRALVSQLFVAEMETVEGDKEKIEEMVNSKINADDHLKALASTDDGGKSFSAPSKDRSGEKKLEAGYEDDLISVRKAGR